MLTEGMLIDRLKSKCAKHGDQRRLAIQLGVSQAYLSEVLSGAKGIGDDLARAMGFFRCVSFERIKKGKP